MRIDMGISGPRKKKVDYEALGSTFMQIPGMDVLTARCLMDIGVKERFELRGRSPEVLYEEMVNLKGDVGKERLYALRMAVYYEEAEEVDMQLMRPAMWV